MGCSSKISTYNPTTKAAIDAKVLSAAQQISLKVQNILKEEIFDNNFCLIQSMNEFGGCVSRDFFRKYIDKKVVELTKASPDVLLKKVLEEAEQDLNKIEEPIYGPMLRILSFMKNSYSSDRPDFGPTEEDFIATRAEFWYSQGMPEIQKLMQDLNSSFTPEVINAYKTQLSR